MLLGLGALSQNVRAQTVTVGAGIGGIGGVSSGSSIGWSGHVNVNSLGWAAFQADILMASFKSGFFVAGTPAFVFYPVDLDGVLFGPLVGVGFYRIPNDATTFGFNYGVTGDFGISKKLSVGMTARQHLMTGAKADTLWDVMMNLSYKFDGGGDW